MVCHGGRLHSVLLLPLLIFISRVAANSLYDPSDPILELDNDNFNSSAYGQKRAFFVEFYSSWCGACIGYAPTFKKFARQLESWSPIVQVTVVNCAEDKNMPLCREHQIAAFPTLNYFKYNSQKAEDAVQFTGDKHDLAPLPLQVAQLVHDNWETERPPEWPSFEAIAPSTTVKEIWSASEGANLVAVVAQMYKKAHDAIRANPEALAKKEKKVEKKRWTRKSLTYDERKSRVATKKAFLLHLVSQSTKMAEEKEEDIEEEEVVEEEEETTTQDNGIEEEEPEKSSKTQRREKIALDKRRKKRKALQGQNRR